MSRIFHTAPTDAITVVEQFRLRGCSEIIISEWVISCLALAISEPLYILM